MVMDDDHPEQATWDDIDATRWERLPFRFSMGFPYTIYVNHYGWVYRYTFSKNANNSFLVMNVVREFDQLTVFHGRVNPFDIIWGRDPVTKMRRFLWFARKINFDEEIADIYVFMIPDWIKQVD